MLDIKKIEAAINQISAEKKIDKTKLIEIIEHAIKTAYKKDFGSKDTEVNVRLNLEEGTIEITVEKEVVDEITNPYIQISREELGEDASEFELGDKVEIDVSDDILANEDGFGRIASQAARQVIIQKIQEGEKEKIFNLFKNKEGEIVSLKIELVEKNKILLDYNGNTVVLPKSEQVAKDKYTPGQRIYVYVGKVEENTMNGPKVTLTRKDVGLVEKLFEMNVPELKDGTVEIVRIARNAGFKTKIIVGSEYEEVDPAGCLIGPKGIRVKMVVDELFGEKVDVINYTTDMKELVKRSLAPAQVIDVKVNEDSREATVYLTEEEKIKAVGKGGSNINLATDLINYRINLVTTNNQEGSI